MTDRLLAQDPSLIPMARSSRWHHNPKRSRAALLLTLTLALIGQLLISSPVANAADSVTISGTVRNTAGEPVPGVVLVSNWSSLTFGRSDADGKFSFAIDPADTVLDLRAFFDSQGGHTDPSTEARLVFQARTTLDTMSVPALDIVVPDQVMHTVAVVDAAGDALAGIAISGSVSGPNLGLGTSQTWNTMAWTTHDPVTCTTGANGECQFRTFASFLDPANPGTVHLASGQTASNHPLGNLSGSSALTAPITTITTSTAQAEALVHGTVRDATGTTVTGARIRTSVGSTAVSEADGSYGVYVLQSSTVTVGAYAGFDPATSEVSAPAPDTGLADLNQPCDGLDWTGMDDHSVCEVIGTTVQGFIEGDLLLDIALPAISERAVHVESASGTAISDANVLGSGRQHTQTTDADGVVTRHIYSAGWVQIPWGHCLTDTAGNCSLHALIESSDASLSAWAFKGLTVDSDGSTVTSTFDAYGVADHLSAPVTTIRVAFWTNASQGMNTGDVIVAVTQPDPERPSGRALSDVSIEPAPSLPSGQVSPSGELAYTVSDVPVGGSIDVMIDLPAGSAPTAVYKNTAAGLVDVSSIATITGDTIVMHLTDGEFGDEDGIANGVIVDPVIPVRQTTTSIGLTTTRSNPIFGQRTLLKTVITGPTGRRIPSGTVRFSEGSTTLGTATVRSGRANFILPPTSAAGEHQITATYSDIVGGTVPSASALVTVTVQQAITRMVVSGPSAKLVGQLVTLGVRVLNRPPGKGVPTGTVTFTDNGTPIGTVALDAYGRATFSTTALPAGAHTIVATYSGDPNHTLSDSTRSLVIR